METAKSYLSTIIPLENEVFSGGFGLAILALGAKFLRGGSSAALTVIRKNIFITLEVTSKDRSYPWVLQWISAQGKRTQHLSVDTCLSSVGGRVSTSFSFVPGMINKYYVQIQLIIL
jgi:chaperone BCS1